MLSCAAIGATASGRLVLAVGGPRRVGLPLASHALVGWWPGVASADVFVRLLFRSLACVMGLKSLLTPSSSAMGVAVRLSGWRPPFDGGVRELFGARVGGAGAVLWGLDGRSGLLRRLASASMALPDVGDSQVAEAWGAHLVSLLLREHGLRGERRVRISGDNLAVVRHCAAQGRLRRPCAQAALGPVLARLAAGGWQVTWQAIRLRSNMAADGEATAGVFWAARLRRGGLLERRVRIRWGEPSAAGAAGGLGS